MWFMEMAISPLFYVPLFHTVLKIYGVAQGSVVLFFIQIMISLVLILTYDWMGRDIFGIEHARVKIKSRMTTWRTFQLPRPVALATLFVLLALLFSGPVLFLCFRKSDESKLSLRSTGSLFAVIALKTIVWVQFNQLFVTMVWK